MRFHTPSSNRVDPLESRQLLASSIQGTIWSDLDGDQLMEPSEPRLADVVVFLDDRVRDGKLGKHEKRTRTDAKGNYTFSNVPKGKHVVAAVAPEETDYQSWPVVGSTFDIDFAFDGSLSNRERIAFAEAGEKWERIIIGDVRNVGGHVDDVEIEVKPTGSQLDDGTLAVTTLPGVRKVAPRTTFQALIVINESFRRINDRDLLYAEALHEIGHALGFGGLWEDKELTNASATTYTGQFALDQYKTLFGQPASTTSIPLQTGSGEGSDGSHWAASFSVLEDGRSEVMSSSLNNDSDTRLSTLTVGAIRDLGYEVNYRAADPWNDADASLFRDRNPDEVIASNRTRRYSIKLKRDQNRRRLDFGFVPKATETTAENTGGNNAGNNAGNGANDS